MKLTDHEKDLLRKGASLSEPYHDSHGGLDYCFFTCPWCGAKEYSDDYEDVFVFAKEVENNLKHEADCDQQEYKALIERLIQEE